MNTRARPMPAQEFRRARREVLVKWNLDKKEWEPLGEREASVRLGVSRQFLRNMDEHGAPLYIAYEIAAIEKGLKPWGVTGSIYWSDHKKKYTDKPTKD